jgi:hemolysin activation/secretion protein
MEYKLSAPFDSTNPSGYSSEYNLSLNRPLIESPNFNLNTSFSLGNNIYVNDLGTGNNSDKDVLKSIFNLGFDSRDERLGGGINYGSFALSLAKNDLTDNLSNYETDQSTSDNNGRNFKGTLNLNRMQKLTDKTNLLVKFNGQLAADNLDGADQFSLGGLNAVRAYPSSEATGDAGFVASLELKRNLFKNLESTLFYDYGKIKLHKSLWNDWNSTNKLKNNYHLQGYGVSVGIPIFQNFSINATHAKKIGTNSGRDSSGNDVDGFSWKDRSLISINGKF